ALLAVRHRGPALAGRELLIHNRRGFSATTVSVCKALCVCLAPVLILILQQKRLDFKIFFTSQQYADSQMHENCLLQKVQSSFGWRKYGRKRRELALPADPKAAATDQPR